MKMENMTARQFLWRIIRSTPRRSRLHRYRLSLLSRSGYFGRSTILHILPTNDTSAIDHVGHFLSRRIGVKLVHVVGRSSEAAEISELGDEGAKGDVDVAENVEGKSVECENEAEEGEVGDELEEVCIISCD